MSDMPLWLGALVLIIAAVATVWFRDKDADREFDRRLKHRTLASKFKWVRDGVPSLDDIDAARVKRRMD